VVAEIVRLITPAYPDLDERERARVNESVTGFVTSQIEALPAFLALPYGLAITAFQLLAILRFGRRFLSLPEAVKPAYLSIWADAKIGPARDLIKLIRSCALLAYFDHPDVLRHLPASSASGPVAIADGAADAS
jgi:hypothetical protein